MSFVARHRRKVVVRGHDLRPLCFMLAVTAFGCAEVEAEPASRRISVACRSSPATGMTLHRWELEVRPTSTIGDDFAALLSGTVIFSRAFLNERMQGVVKMHLFDLHATVRVYSGATGEPVTLVPALPYHCLDDPEITCDPANDDGDTVLGSRGNTDCDDPFGALQNPCGQFVELQTSSDCEGVCEGMGAASICREFKSCVVEDLEIELRPQAGLYSADANASTVLFGWEEGEPTGATTVFDTTATEVWDLQPPSLVEPVGPMGLRANLSATSPQDPIVFNCTMGVDSIDPEALGPTIISSTPTPPEMLLAIPIPR